MESLAPQQMSNSTSQMPKLELQDIHLPTQISDYPIALGWWLLLAIIIAVCVFSLIKYRQIHHRKKSQKLALQQLKENLVVAETIALLKWAAIQYFPRQQVAKLYGNEFQNFLKTKLPVKDQQNFMSLSADLFSHHYKNKDVNLVDTKFYQASKLWLSKALPAKTIKKSKMKSTKSKQGETT